MAHKKASRTKYNSKVQRINTNKSVLKSIKRERTYLDIMTIRMSAWMKGKPVKGFDGIYVKPFFKMPNQPADESA